MSQTALNGLPYAALVKIPGFWSSPVVFNSDA